MDSNYTAQTPDDWVTHGGFYPCDCGLTRGCKKCNPFEPFEEEDIEFIAGLFF